MPDMDQKQLVAEWEARLGNLSEASLRSADSRHRCLISRVRAHVAGWGNLGDGNSKTKAKLGCP